MMDLDEIEKEVHEMRMTHAETRGYLRRLRAAMDLFPQAISLLVEASEYGFDDCDLQDRICEFLDILEESANGSTAEAAE